MEILLFIKDYNLIKQEKVGYSGHRFTETKIKPIQTQVRQS